MLTRATTGTAPRSSTLGNGLTGMRERLEQLGGDVAVDGREGFRVMARLPAP